MPLAEHTLTKSAISQARREVGAGVLKQLYEEQVKPIDPPGMPGVWYRGHRLMALDGSAFDMPDEVGNAERFGYATTPRGEAGFPQLRLVALVECGTHVLCHARSGPYAEGEMSLAKAVASRAEASMLILADRGFFGFRLWQPAHQTGARLFFRVPGNRRLPCEQVLPDGSYLSRIHDSQLDKHHRQPGLPVRVIEYALEGIPDPEPAYRLVTNWLDPEAAPAEELAALYHRRWTIEQTLDELKAHLADRPVVLRSKTSDLVKQKFYALLLAHAAIRRLMVEAASRGKQAAEDLSFIHAVRVLKRRLPAAAAISPSAPAGLA